MKIGFVVVYHQEKLLEIKIINIIISKKIYIKKIKCKYI